MFYVFLFLGLLIRLILIPIAGFKADIAFWKGWGLAVADKGIVWLVNNTNYNYPPGFAYILWVINKIYGLFSNAHNINEYWVDGNVFYLFLIKSVTILADLLIVWLIIRISRVILGSNEMTTPESNNDSGRAPSSLARMTKNVGKLLALFYFLNPAVLYDGVVWGQVDQLGVALFISAFYLAWQKKPYWGAAIFVLSCMMKFQNIIFIPLFYLFIYKQYSFNLLVKSLIVSIISFIIIVFPFFISHQMDTIVRLIVINADWFPWYSLNAFNIWWIISGLKGMEMVDKHLFIGILSAKQFGFYLFIFAYFISCVLIFFARKEEVAKNFILASILAVFAFFHLLTQSHERYLFPLMALLPIIFLFRIKDRLDYLHGSISKSQIPMTQRIPNPNDQTIEQKNLNHLKIGNWNLFGLWDLVIGILISLFFFVNMYLSMGWNYPDQVIPSFTKAGTLGLSWWISVIQIVLFIIFIFWFLKNSLIRHIRLIGLISICIVAAIFFKHIPYLLGKPISLTSFKPVGISQDYLSPIYNKTVESNRGTNYWNRLSVNYFFYEKGIGSHADSNITYHMAKRFSTFTTDYGLDTEADVSAKVYFSILGDGRELFKSKEKGRFDKPESKTVDIRGVNYLTLKITKAGDNNFGAHADWLNPVLIR